MRRSNSHPNRQIENKVKCSLLINLDGLLELRVVPRRVAISQGGSVMWMDVTFMENVVVVGIAEVSVLP